LAGAGQKKYYTKKQDGYVFHIIGREVVFGKV